MTDRLYYTDPYRRDFDATVVCVERRGDRTLVVLDRTAFYPTSGGQPNDLGTLGAARVVDVLDQDDGTVAHVVEGDLHPGEAVRGTIDWPRRFDHMQQHTGQHVLSAAFDRLFGARTVSFHLGADASTIDIGRELKAAEIAAAEDEANRVVWDDRPVEIRFVAAEDAAALPLRKRLPTPPDAAPRDAGRGQQGVTPLQPGRTKPSQRSTLRLIEVGDFDLSACGGTHVARTGGIGVIAVGGWERFKGGQRIEFLCGGRALARFRALRDSAAASMRLLSVGRDEVPPSIERLLGDARDQKRAAVALQQELARYRAEELARSADPSGGVRLVLRAVDADANGLKSLASAVAARPGFAVVLVSTTQPALVVVARSTEGTAGLPPANDVLASLTSAFGGRGGGKPELAQGGGLNASVEAILGAARAALSALP
ncbi:MAG: alanyl-tRNA editing protein [Betaproteobacteria bacterium]